MADHKQGTELNDLKAATGVPASGTQGAGLNQASLIDGLDMDIEKTGDAVHSPGPAPAPASASAPAPEILVSAASPSPGPGLADEVDDEKKPGFFGKVKQFLQAQLKKPIRFWNKTDKRTMLTASSCFVTVMMLCAMISLAVVTVHGSRLTTTSSAAARAVQLHHVPGSDVHKVTVQQRDQFSTYLSDDTEIVPVTSVGVSDTCDKETGTATVPFSAVVTTTNNVNVNLTSTSIPMMQSASIMPVSVDVLTMSHPSVTPFLATSSMDQAATSSMAPPTLLSFNSQSCLEYGDGAGPCARPYGRPNSTPESWIASLAAESVADASTLLVGDGIDTTMLPIGIPAMASANPLTSSLTDASLSTWFDSATIDASLCEPTATLYVTITAAAAAAAAQPKNVSLTGPGNSPSTVHKSSTSLSILTVTWSGSDGPLTTTETAFRGGASGTAGQTVVAINGTGGLTTLNVPNYTLTMQTTVGPNGTAFSSADPTALAAPYITSGGEQLTAPKPLSMSGSSSGNGVYCVVMLAALVVLFI